jgi:glycosyltransferase involved in cell wall biosynthesis
MTRVALLGPANSIHLQRWAAALAQRGHALAVISQHRCERSLLPAAAEVVWLPHGGSLGYFRNARPLRTVLAQWQPDILNAHYASGYGSTAALCGYAPTLLSVWGSDVYDFPYEGALKGWLLRRNLRSATALASTSEAMARQVRRLLLGREAIAITPFGVDLARFAPSPAPRADGPLMIGIVKSLAPKYGVDLLLRAFAGLVGDAAIAALPHPCRLLIVGDGPERATLEALANTLGIAALTCFTGSVAHADVPTYLNRLDIYAAPSRLDSESFGVAVIEASACGLPVVVSDAGGLPEVVREGATGLIVPRNDIPALQAALKRLVLDPQLRAELGRGGREHVARNYEWGHCVDLMERAYRETIARGRPR